MDDEKETNSNTDNQDVTAFCNNLKASLPTQPKDAIYSSSYRPGECYGGISSHNCECFDDDPDTCNALSNCGFQTNQGKCLSSIKQGCEKTATSIYSSDSCLKYLDCQYNPPPPAGRCEGSAIICSGSCSNLYTCSSRAECNTYAGVTACTEVCGKNSNDCSRIGDDYDRCNSYSDCRWVSEEGGGSSEAPFLTGFFLPVMFLWMFI